MTEKASKVTTNELVLDQSSTKLMILREKNYFFVKRSFDIVAATLGLALTSPILLLVAIAIKLSDFGPVIYTQERVGKDGKIFNIYKFRSMKTNSADLLKELLKDPKIAKEWKNNHKLDNDPRITKVGKFIRIFSIDELPQLVNVLKGDMSIVGPRPLIKGEIESYGGSPEIYQCVRPGLTGWWASNGRSSVEKKERLELEYYYIDNCDVKLDIKCILRTIRTLFVRDNVK